MWRDMIRLCAIAWLVGVGLEGCSTTPPPVQREERDSIPTAEEIAKAITVPLCPVAEGDTRFDGKLIRVKGYYSTLAENAALTGDDCERIVFLSFDGEVERLTPKYAEKRATLASASITSVVVVGRVHVGPRTSAGPAGVRLTVYVVESVEH